MTPKQAAAKKASATAKNGELDFDLLPGLVGYQLRLTQLTYFYDFAKSVEDPTMSPGRFGVLVLIGANPGMTQSRLALATQLDRSTMVAVIDLLESRGLVERRATPMDRRSNALWLTEKGKKLLRAMKQKVKAHDERLSSAIGAEGSAQLIAMLTRVRESMQTNDE